MDGSIEIDQLAWTKFGIGQPVPRNEDPMLVRGQPTISTWPTKSMR
jgi:hypothetical protein